MDKKDKYILYGATAMVGFLTLKELYKSFTDKKAIEDKDKPNSVTSL